MTCFFHACLRKGGENKVKTIKIYTKSQLILLRNVNPFLRRYRLPKKVLKRIDYILEEEHLGKQGFLLILLAPVKDDIREIENGANVYPLKLEFTADLECIKVRNIESGKIKSKELFLVKLYIPKTESQKKKCKQFQKKKHKQHYRKNKADNIIGKNRNIQ